MEDSYEDYDEISGMMTQRQEDATWHNQHSDAPEFEEQNGAPGNGSGRRREQEASETSHELSYHTGVAADRAERGAGLRKGQGCGGGRRDVAREGRASEWGRERGVSVGEAREKGVSVRVESGRGVSGRRDDEEEEAKEGEKEHVVEEVGEEKDEEEEEEEEEEGDDEADVMEVSDTDGEREEHGTEAGEEEGGEGGGGDGGEEEEVYGSVEEVDVDCPICGCHLSHLEPIRREQHSNACLDAWGRDKGEEEETETCKMGADTDARGRDRGEEETERGRMDGGGGVKAAAYGKREERGGREEEEGERSNACLDEERSNACPHAWGKDRGEGEKEMRRTGVGGRVTGTGVTREESGAREEEEGDEKEEEEEGEEGEDENSAMARMLWRRIEADSMGMTMKAWRKKLVEVRGEECEEEEEQEGKDNGEKGKGEREAEETEEVENERRQLVGQSGDVSGGLSGAAAAQKRLITDFFGGSNRHRPPQQQQQQKAIGDVAPTAGIPSGLQQGAGRGVRWGGRFEGRGGSGRGGGGVSGSGGGGMSRGRGGGWNGGRGRGGVLVPEDAFKRTSPSCHHWFLTHFHADHYNGLTKSFRFGTVYCSPVTARLVKLRLGLPGEKICELPMGERVEIAGVGVTLMDANHCPGAVMILFEPPNGQAVLHTGDFRWHPSMAALPSLAATCIHTLILDTTYCHPKYEFPPQEAALQFVVEAIQAEAFNTSALFLLGTYTIGKEKVFLEAAKALKRKVYVGAVKRRLLACLGLSNDDMAWVAGDGEEASTNLHAVPLWSISSFKRIEHIAKFHRQRYSTIIAFSPSGWAFDKCKKARPIRRTQRGTIV
ncbi:unnamed protein product, partial [Closterium sp. Naga37s-1]